MSLTRLLNRWFGKSTPSFPPRNLPVDLGRFSCGRSRLGEPVDATDYFAESLRRGDVFADAANGLELELAGGVLDTVFLTLESFHGHFFQNGTPIALSTTTTEADVLAIFGTPYWTDRSDGEVILFYEPDGGRIEVQFEFPKATTLGYVLFTRHGVLAREDQRKAYGVTRPWPP